MRPPSRPRPVPRPEPAQPARREPATGSTSRTGTTTQRPRTGAVPRAVPRADRPPSAGTAVVPAGREVPPRVSTAMADRLAERSAMRRHRTWRRVLTWVLVVAVVAGVVWGALWSPVLALDEAEVVVTGEGTTVDPDAVREIVAASDRTPLPRLDTVAMREEILGLRGVKDVSLARAWPHGLRVALTARVPVAAVPDAGRYAVLDSEGVRLGTRSKVPSGLAEVEVPLDDARALQAALHVLAALPKGLAAKVTDASAPTQDAVETVLEDGTTVRWGSGEDMPLKVSVVQTLRKVAPDARTIDVSSPELPVTR